MDDEERLELYGRFLRSAVPLDLRTLSEREGRLARMLTGSLVDKTFPRAANVQDGLAFLWAHPQVREELGQLMDALSRRREHVTLPLAHHSNLPLQVHARYSRIEILAACGVGTGAKVSPWQTGVFWAAEAKVDLLAFTLDKTQGHFSPTTRYRDYAISPELIHWESQSLTRGDSETGRRYQEHQSRGSSVFLFARLRSDERAFWFLGPAVYVRHEGERPMAVTWRLRHPLPGDLFADFAAAVA